MFRCPKVFLLTIFWIIIVLSHQVIPFRKKFQMKFFAEMFQLPKMPKMMAIGKHSHFGDTSSLVWHFTIFFSLTLMFNALTQGKYLLVTSPNVLRFMNYIRATHSNYLTQKLCCSGTNLYIGDKLQLSDT